MPGITFKLNGNASSFNRSVAQSIKGIGRLKLGMSSLAGAFAKSAASFGKFTAKMGKKVFSGFVGSIKRAVSSLGRMTYGLATLQTNMLGIKAVMGGFNFAKSVVQSFTGLEERMLKIKAVTQSTRPQMKGLRRIIDGLGLSTQFTTNEIADAVFSLGTLGVKGTAAFKQIMPVVTAAATSLDVDLNRAAEIVLSTMKVFNIEMKDSARVADLLVNAYTNSSLNAEKWAIAQSYAGLAAKTFGRSLEDVLPLLEALSDQGVEASIAGTQIRTGFLMLLAPSAAAKKALKELGLTLADISVQQHGFIGVLENLGKAGMNNSQALAIFGKRAMPIIQALMKTQKEGKKGAEALKIYQKQLMKVGSAANQAKQRQSGLSFALKVLNASWDQLKITLGETLQKWFHLSGLSDQLSAKLGKLSKVVKAIDFKALKTVTMKLFNPTDLKKNLEKAINNVLPAFMTMAGNALAFGGSALVNLLEKALPTLLKVAGFSFLRIIIEGFKLATDSILAAGQAVGTFLEGALPSWMVTQGASKKFYEGLRANNAAFYDEISTQYLKVKPINAKELKRSYDEFSKAVSSVWTKEQKDAAKEFVNGVKKNMKTNAKALQPMTEGERAVARRDQFLKEEKAKKLAVNLLGVKATNTGNTREVQGQTSDIKSPMQEKLKIREYTGQTPTPTINFDQRYQINHNYRASNKIAALTNPTKTRNPKGY